MLLTKVKSRTLLEIKIEIKKNVKPVIFIISVLKTLDTKKASVMGVIIVYCMKKKVSH